MMNGAARSTLLAPTLPIKPTPWSHICIIVTKKIPNIVWDSQCCRLEKWDECFPFLSVGNYVTSGYLSYTLIGWLGSLGAATVIIIRVIGQGGWGGWSTGLQWLSSYYWPPEGLTCLRFLRVPQTRAYIHTEMSVSVFHTQFVFSCHMNNYGLNEGLNYSQHWCSDNWSRDVYK